MGGGGGSGGRGLIQAMGVRGTFSNMSVIYWMSVLLLDQTEIARKSPPTFAQDTVKLYVTSSTNLIT